MARKWEEMLSDPIEGEQLKATQEIKINHSTHEETGWKRYIRFTYKGENYDLVLYWNEFDGYDTYWRTTEYKAPKWAAEWDEDEHEGMSLGHYLDELTWEMK